MRCWVAVWRHANAPQAGRQRSIGLGCRRMVPGAGSGRTRTSVSNSGPHPPIDITSTLRHGQETLSDLVTRSNRRDAPRPSAEPSAARVLTRSTVTSMALFHLATISPTKEELIAEWAPTQPWGPPADVPTDVIGSYRFDDPDGRVGMEIHLVDAGGMRAPGPAHLSGRATGRSRTGADHRDGALRARHPLGVRRAARSAACRSCSRPLP